MMKYYKHKYYLNASHSYNGREENAHSHTFAITLCIEVMHESSFQSFYGIEKYLTEYFEHFSKQYLNEMAEFQDVNPTIENMGDYFYEELKASLSEKNMNLIQLEVCENPVRSYIISDRILLTSEYLSDNQKRWENILKTRERVISMLKKRRGANHE